MSFAVRFAASSTLPRGTKILRKAFSQVLSKSERLTSQLRLVRSKNDSNTRGTLDVVESNSLVFAMLRSRRSAISVSFMGLAPRFCSLKPLRTSSASSSSNTTPPKLSEPAVARMEKEPLKYLRIVTSNVRPPRSKTRIVRPSSRFTSVRLIFPLAFFLSTVTYPYFLLSNSAPIAAATGQLIIFKTSNPALVAASFSFCFSSAENRRGAVRTTFFMRLGNVLRRTYLRTVLKRCSIISSRVQSFPALASISGTDALVRPCSSETTPTLSSK
mmetsp:Transcript_63/g.108  ORF Transcript_63/g.108 Transcript_63/m.108 type:complete len:272 (+) Transcript_63:1032-1847(+)